MVSGIWNHVSQHCLCYSDGQSRLTFIGLTDNPCGCVTDTKVQHLSAVHQRIERLHNLWDARSIIPPVHVQQVNVVGLKLLQRRLERYTERLGAVELMSVHVSRISSKFKLYLFPP